MRGTVPSNRVAALVLVSVTLASGCGDSGGKALSSEDKLAVASAESAIASFCVEGEDGERLGEFGPVLQGIDDLTRIYRKDPEAEYDGRTMREVVSDSATRLDDCSPEEARELDRVLEAS